MDNNFTLLENVWQKKAKNMLSNGQKKEAILNKISNYKKQNFRFYYGNIIVLSITLLALLAFFYFVAPVREWLSRIGAGMMIIGLASRIIIEVISTFKAKKILIFDSSLQNINKSIAFHQHRKRVHSFIMPFIIVLYTIGFYLITPEFLDYIPSGVMLFYNVMYLIFMAFLLFQIRKEIRKEMKILSLNIDLKNEFLAA